MMMTKDSAAFAGYFAEIQPWRFYTPDRRTEIPAFPRIRTFNIIRFGRGEKRGRHWMQDACDESRVRLHHPRHLLHHCIDAFNVVHRGASKHHVKLSGPNWKRLTDVSYSKVRSYVSLARLVLCKGDHHLGEVEPNYLSAQFSKPY